MVQTDPLIAAPGKAPSIRRYNYAVGSLRAFVICLVVAHHTALAYFPIPQMPRKTLLDAPRLWPIFPVLDSQHWAPTALFVSFNDSFFMSMMFLISGLFFWQALARKGVGTFLLDRMLRLGVPFLFMIGLVSPIAYYPSYLQTTAHAGLLEFWHQWRSLGMWPGGPAWFLWLLLTFDGIAAPMFSSRPSWAAELGRLMARLAQRPLFAYLVLVACSAAVYIPLSMLFPAASWTTVGPFAFQTSRILHYFVYFLFGVAIGVPGIDRSIIAPNSRLAAKWWVASIAAVVVFALYTISSPFAARPGASPFWALGFVVSCATSCFAFLAIFSRFMQGRHPVWDSLAVNSFGIYVVHYAFVSWLQYAMLPANLPGFAKCLLVFVGAVLLSWTATIAIRRSSMVSRVI